MDFDATWDWGRWIIGIMATVYGVSLFIGPLEITIFYHKVET